MRVSRQDLKILLAATCVLTLPAAHSDTSRFNHRLLDTHNRERIAVGGERLRWDEDLARDAQNWAHHLAATRTLKHAAKSTKHSGAGENIWRGTRGYFTPEQMVGRWINEKRHFRAGAFPNNSVTGNVADVGHYTQVIWRQTYEVGCGVASNTSHDILVCRYRNPGNIVGERPI